MRGRLKGRDWAHGQAIFTAYHTAAWGSFSKRLPSWRSVSGARGQAPKPMTPEQMSANLRRWAIRLGAKPSPTPNP